MKQAPRTREEMYPLVEQFLESQETIKSFATSHDLPKSVFEYWLRKYRKEQADDSAFVEVTPSVIGTHSQPYVEVVHPQGIQLRFFAPVSASYLATLLRVEARSR
jgi:transposase-like protein